MEPSGKKRLLILASKLGYQTREFADAAEKLGVEVSFGTDRCHNLDDPWSDGALALHFEKPREAAAEIARELAKNAPDGILALGDRPTSTAALVAEFFRVPGNPYEAVENSRNKLRQRSVLTAAGLPVPEFFSFPCTENITQVLPRVKFPCVVKPVSLAASQGVMRANDGPEFERTVARLRKLLAAPDILALREPGLDEILVERYIPGREVAVEGLLTDGRLRVLAIFDKPDPLEGPFFEETIYATPSRLPSETQAAIEDCASRTIRALGLVTGPLHAEFRVNEHGPWVLEASPRPIGGLCSRALRFGPDKTSLEGLLIRHSLQLGGSEAEREKTASAVMMIPVPQSGVFEGVEGIEQAERVAGIEEIRITARLRDYVAAWPEGSSYLGFIFARAEEPGEAEQALRAAHAKLQFRFSPRLAVEHPATGRMRA